MLTEERISRFYEDVEKLGLKRPVAAITKATGYSKGNVSMYLGKKAPPSENFIDKFYEAFGESFKKVPHETAREAFKEQISSTGATQDISLQAIKNLTDTGKIHAENYKVMVSNEARLISLLEKSTAGSQTDNGVASPKVMSGILVAMAKIASGTRWHSEDEALRELGRLLSPPVDESKKIKDIPVD